MTTYDPYKIQQDPHMTTYDPYKIQQDPNKINNALLSGKVAAEKLAV